MGREVVLYKSVDKTSNLEIASNIRQVADKIEQAFMKLGQNEKRVNHDFPPICPLK